MRIREQQLIIPALYIIGQRETTTTAELKKELEKLLHPEGEDLEILDNRNDTKFSQKVRNLISHSDINGMSKYIRTARKGKYTITQLGIDYLKENQETVEYLFGGDFSSQEQLVVAEKLEKARESGKKLLIYRENEKIQEGELVEKTSTTRKRSQKLRKAAVDYYKKQEGELRCAACGFSFAETYGELGEDFIEMHHEKPLFQYEDEALETYLDEAVKNMKPLCANCHRMIHRNRKNILTVEQLKEKIKKH